MDHFTEPELPGSKSNFRRTQMSTGSSEQRRTVTSDDVVMHDLIPRVPSVDGSVHIPFGRPYNPIGDLSTKGLGSTSGDRESGNTFPQMRKKTMATKSVSTPVLTATKSVTSPRVRFVHKKAATAPRPSRRPANVMLPQNVTASLFFPPPVPARKAGSSLHFRKQQQQSAANPQPTPFSVKTVRPFVPLWQQLDEEHDRVKRKRDVRWISSTGQFRENISQNVDQRRNKANIAPKLQLRLDGQIDLSSSSGDEDELVRPVIPVKVTAGRQVAVKKSAARKVEVIDATSSDESSKESEAGPTTMDNDSQEEDQLFPEEYELSPDQRFHDPRRRHPTVFNPAPQITIPLPQVKAEPEDDVPVGDLGPPEELLNALEALTIGPIRMQATRQLPFLRRNLRRGFTSRCENVLIPIHSDRKLVDLEVSYEYVDGIAFQANIGEWLCPLCNLFGKFATQATLFCHLKWDHQEVFTEWKKIEESDVRQRWKLQVTIPQDAHDDEEAGLVAQHLVEDAEQQDEEENADASDEHTPGSPSIPVSRFSSPFPSVEFSPISSRQQSKMEREPASPSMPPIKAFRETPPPAASRSISAPQPPSSRSRSMTQMSRHTAATTTTATPRARYPSGGPIPPPPDDPLGPAARPPYLPAHSDYGGPTVYYSCRPGGACLFDFLGTLPTKEFGILEWQVLDGEEEIYESDDVKEEYKVMHALWARWIMLHRNKFISNYYQGTLAFVDYYWPMIHRAAGWDALRYWLLILLANQFLTSHEVAQVLLHYEEHTGMATWYDQSW